MSPLFVVVLNLLAVGYASGGTCGTNDGTCYYIDDPCPVGMEDCSDKYDCDLVTNKCCCTKLPEPRKLCGTDNVADTCFYNLDPCPTGYEDCTAKYYCTVETNKCCCKI